ncbi:MAG: hypothetical protein SGJ09_09335 [Phycisphaerae bacterium]|nr:hypothetical protein [Phycisphaerae bacterium]
MKALDSVVGEKLGDSKGGAPVARSDRSNLRAFVEARRAYLLNHPEIEALADTEAPSDAKVPAAPTKPGAA